MVENESGSAKRSPSEDDDVSASLTKATHPFLSHQGRQAGRRGNV